MKIYDKAMWQIDNGVEKSMVINHFKFVFEWLKNQNMLNNNGLEIFDIGIDEEVSLNESLLTDKGNEFVDMYYDELISSAGYDFQKEKELINELYSKFSKNGSFEF